MILRFEIDYRKIADIVEHHVLPGSAIADSEEQVKAEEVFAKKLAGWEEYDREYREAH